MDTQVLVHSPGTPKEKLRFKYYHPNYCKKLGHRDARYKLCFVNGLSSVDRENVSKMILDEAIAREIQNSSIYKSYFSNMCTYFVHIVAI